VVHGSRSQQKNRAHFIRSNFLMFLTDSWYTGTRPEFIRRSESALLNLVVHPSASSSTKLRSDASFYVGLYTHTATR